MSDGCFYNGRFQRVVNIIQFCFSTCRLKTMYDAFVRFENNLTKSKMGLKQCNLMNVCIFMLFFPLCPF